MMLAWKSAACLAAGNTLVLKTAQVKIKRNVQMAQALQYLFRQNSSYI